MRHHIRNYVFLFFTFLLFNSSAKAASFPVGSQVEVAAEASLFSGTTVVGQVHAGERYLVADVQGDWVSLKKLDGAAVSGWLGAGNLKLVAEPVEQPFIWDDKKNDRDWILLGNYIPAGEAIERCATAGYVLPTKHDYWQFRKDLKDSPLYQHIREIEVKGVSSVTMERVVMIDLTSTGERLWYSLTCSSDDGGVCGGFVAMTDTLPLVCYRQKDTAPGPKIVSGKTVEITSAADLYYQSDIVGHVGAGEKYRVAAVQGSWVSLEKLDATPIKGWIKMSFLRLVE